MCLSCRGIFYNKYPKRAEGKGRGDLGTETDINLKQQLVYHVMGRHQVTCRCSTMQRHSCSERLAALHGGAGALMSGLRLLTCSCQTQHLLLLKPQHAPHH